MKKIFLCCVLSALLGASFAAWVFSNGGSSFGTNTARAQEFVPASIGAPVVSATIPPNSVLTPEELTNIRVYDGANRGVVNILTRTVSRDRFFMMPTPGEGAGSGSVLDKQGH